MTDECPDAGLRHVGTREPGDTRPDRAVCRFCTRMITREPGSAEWTAAAGPGLDGRTTQCPQAPNPSDGPTPGHTPDGYVVHPPPLESPR